MEMSLKMVDTVDILRRGWTKGRRCMLLTSALFDRPYLMSLVFLTAPGQKSNNRRHTQVLEHMLLDPRRMEEDC